MSWSNIRYPTQNLAGGYLMIGDDVALDLCAITSLNTSKLWQPSVHRNLAQPVVDVHTVRDWHWDRSLASGKAVRWELKLPC